MKVQSFMQMPGLLPTKARVWCFVNIPSSTNSTRFCTTKVMVKLELQGLIQIWLCMRTVCTNLLPSEKRSVSTGLNSDEVFEENEVYAPSVDLKSTKKWFLTNSQRSWENRQRKVPPMKMYWNLLLWLVMIHSRTNIMKHKAQSPTIWTPLIRRTNSSMLNY